VSRRRAAVETDGRNIDPALGTLLGEGSGQEVTVQEKRYPPHVPPQEPGDPTYYGHAVIKKSVWSWSIPLYYYVGGATGGCAVLGAAATAMGRESFPRLVVRSRWIAFAGATISGALLIYDLGRPSRFLNMLRVFRPTSPMNLGSWVLTGFGGLAGASAVMPGAIGDAAGLGAGVFGLVLSGYTGVLVANTVVPVWQRPRRTLPPLFLASAAASASSLLDFFDLSPAEERAVTAFGVMGKLVDLACCQIAEEQVAEVPEVVRPLREGLSGFLWNAGKALSAASLVLSLAPGSSRRKGRWIGVLGTAGALCLRFGIHYAGQASAQNPRATFHQQRDATQ